MVRLSKSESDDNFFQTQTHPLTFLMVTEFLSVNWFAAKSLHSFFGRPESTFCQMTAPKAGMECGWKHFFGEGRLM